MTERKKLPKTRPGIVHRVKITDYMGQESKLYFIVGLYPDTLMPGEIFIKMAKHGSTLAGLMNTVAVEMSYAFQYDLPFAKMMERLRGESFEPSGKTDNEKIPECSSVTDYLVRWLEQTFGPPTEEDETRPLRVVNVEKEKPRREP